MIFTSLTFLGFLTLIAAIYWILPHRFRWIILLAGSFLFYAVSVPSYSLILALTILINYWFGIRIGNQEDGNKRRKVLLAGIIINIASLAVFKYFNSVSEFIYHQFHLVPPSDSTFYSIIVPLGISFFTFSNISYLVEVKRKNILPEKHIGYFAVFVSFFPKLIQGPIERPQHFLPQLRKEHIFDYSNASGGLRLILWGLFKKLVIADRLALGVDLVYGNPAGNTGPNVLVGTLLYAIQIYVDFSAYTDIAIGTARILGFRLSPNFNRPYASKSIKEFWTRWHITFSTWLRDYIFLPFAYSLSRRLKKERYAGFRTDKIIYSVAITLTFLICGIWHGVGWTFLIWGALFAVYLVIGHLTEKAKKRFFKKTGLSKKSWLLSPLQVLITFLLVCFAWIFFRSSDLNTSILLVSKLGTGWTMESWGISSLFSLLKIPDFSLKNMGFVLVLFGLVDLVEKNRSSKWAERFLAWPFYFRWGIYYGLILMIILFGEFGNNGFVYFQF
jgi:alginate O-acetyltransferase complex protein AlgI